MYIKILYHLSLIKMPVVKEKLSPSENNPTPAKYRKLTLFIYDLGSHNV